MRFFVNTPKLIAKAPPDWSLLINNHCKEITEVFSTKLDLVIAPLVFDQEIAPPDRTAVFLSINKESRYLLVKSTVEDVDAVSIYYFEGSSGAKNSSTFEYETSIHYSQKNRTNYLLNTHLVL